MIEQRNVFLCIFLISNAPLLDDIEIDTNGNWFIIGIEITSTLEKVHLIGGTI